MHSRRFMDYVHYCSGEMPHCLFLDFNCTTVDEYFIYYIHCFEYFYFVYLIIQFYNTNWTFTSPSCPHGIETIIIERQIM